MAEKKVKKRLVELIIDEQSERFGVEAISLVEFPNAWWRKSQKNEKRRTRIHR